ncbi:hypothetical protein EYF80_026565 [Liparis tanakae]|uniref:Uncharacterized protein n=1 Tax=Liparis tanakae TaxID=230148 RepID=A0A4Z2HEL3_9TELE|nr:hypothetical protein EYF80_026565 [Liparis tanakae]
MDSKDPSILPSSRWRIDRSAKVRENVRAPPGDFPPPSSRHAAGRIGEKNATDHTCVSVRSYPAPVMVSVLLTARLTTSDTSTLPMADGLRSLS